MDHHDCFCIIIYQLFNRVNIYVSGIRGQKFGVVCEKSLEKGGGEKNWEKGVDRKVWEKNWEKSVVRKVGRKGF